MGTKEHKKNALKVLRIAIISVSSTRTIAEDDSGLWMKKMSKKEGHTVVLHRVVPDDKRRIATALLDAINQSDAQVVLLTGGTGISRKDVTIEAVRPLFHKELTAFGPVFAQVSLEKIDSAAIMSRATAGIVGKTAVFCMPGSLRACKLACKALIFPELGHILKHIYHG
ncbi:MAG: MogA/MoaB family molybdenum cofactor biosynthesis protein [Deltaproteobacteria bacterium]|jgi:molybdenum cofactor biosynthesis protein B|nr:MogA/MoaB family molybdenum cofactor biosynthesis protein [Deltaproteobacteria bacterium]